MGRGLPAGSVNPRVPVVRDFPVQPLLSAVSSPLSSLVARAAVPFEPLRGGGRGWTLLAVGVGWFFVLGLRFVVPALLPEIKPDFTLSNVGAGAAITLLWLTYALMQFPAGILVDRLGERRLLAASALVASVGLVGYAISPTFGVFLVATAVFGLGSGLYGPARGTVLTRAFPRRDGTAFGIVLAAGSIGAALLPVIATLLATVFDWRLAIAVTIPGFLVVAVALWHAVPARTREREGSTASSSTPQPDGGRAAGTDLAAIRRAIGTRRVVLAAVAVTVMLFVFQGLSAFFVTYLAEEKSVGNGTAGALFGLLFVSGAAWQTVGGTLGDRYGYGRVLAAVAVFGSVPLLVLPLVSGFVPLALVAVALGVRLSAGPLSNAYIVATLPPAVRGTAWGLLRTGFFVVGAFGSIAVGAMADADRYTEAFVLLSVLSLLAAVVYLSLPARENLAA
ncbi:MAG: MFS family permease [Haloarculaceae archaeon]|jgi:MFS family permease